MTAVWAAVLAAPAALAVGWATRGQAASGTTAAGDGAAR